MESQGHLFLGLRMKPLEAIPMTVRSIVALVLACCCSSLLLRQTIANGQYLSEPDIVSVPGDVWAPTLSGDDLRLYYTIWRSNNDFDLMVAEREEPDDDFDLFYPLSDLNTSRQEDGVAITQDGLTLIYGSNRGGWDLWEVTRGNLDDDWSDPRNLEEINTTGEETFPFLSGDGRTLLFSSRFGDRPGGLGGSDLWMSTRESGQTQWGEAVNLSTLNTGSGETSPVMGPDGLKLYFTSNRSGGYGNYDVYVATRETTNDEFTDPMNLGPVINTPNLDWNGSVGPDGQLYFVRNAIRGQSPWNIWVADPIDPIVGDLNANGTLDSDDIDLLTEAVIRRRRNILGFDLTDDQAIDLSDHAAWVKDVARTWYGDANLDGEFNSGDLVHVFEAGQYEDNRRRNSRWATGDWNGDGEFDTSDLVTAFTDGGYEQGPLVVNAVPEPASATMLLAILIGSAFFSRTRRQAVR